MSKPETKERIEKLKKLINKYRYDYHVLNKLEISKKTPGLPSLPKPSQK